MNKSIFEIEEPKDMLGYPNLLNDQLIGQTLNGNWQSQTVPSFYVVDNEHFELPFDVRSLGIVPFIASSEGYVTFFLEYLSSLVISKYTQNENQFSKFFEVQRSDIIRFERIGSLEFMAVKPDKTTAMANKFSGGKLGLGGTIGSLAYAGIKKVTGLEEKKLVKKKGELFHLFLNIDGDQKRLDLVAEDFYIDLLNSFLSRHWTTSVPEKESEENEKDDCFVATACFGDYEHPIVVQLRYFRDSFLGSRDWGIRFISFYYRHGPRYARVISNKTVLRNLTRLLLIYPLYISTKILDRIRK